MNNKGQAAALAFMLAVVVLILGLAFAPVINEATNNAMQNSTNHSAVDMDGNVGQAEDLGMGCSNSSISNFQKAGCWVADIGQAYFIGGIIALAGVIIAARVIFD